MCCYDQVAIAQGHRPADASSSHAAGRELIDGGTCLACHTSTESSIGPSHNDVAEKYRGDPEAPERLVKKIREGGSGVWGDVMMPPHPQITEEDARRMVDYILRLGEEEPGVPTLPVEGECTPAATAGEGTVVLRGSYRDRGANGLPGALAYDVLALRSPTVVLAEGEASEGINMFKSPQMPVTLTIVEEPGSYVRFEQIDLTGISEIVFTASAPIRYLNSAGCTIEVRLDAPDGPLAGRSDEIVPGDGGGAPSSYRAVLTPVAGKHDLYFVFRNDEAAEERNLFAVQTALFVSGSAGAAAPVPRGGAAAPAPSGGAASPASGGSAVAPASGGSAVAPASGGGTVAPASGGGTGLSTQSLMKDLLENEQARSVLEKHAPGLTTNPQIGQALQMSLRQIAPYAPDTFSEQVLQAIDEDLRGI